MRIFADLSAQTFYKILSHNQKRTRYGKPGIAKHLYCTGFPTRRQYSILQPDSKPKAQHGNTVRITAIGTFVQLWTRYILYSRSIHPNRSSWSFNIPIFELLDQSIPLAEIIPSRHFTLIEEQLAEVPGELAKISVIERFLCSLLDQKKTDTLVKEAITRIHASRGTIKIKTLSEGLHISQDAFEKRFRNIIGANAKQFSSIVRMRSILEQHSNSTSLVDLALGNGFYDQSHFIREFKKFTGCHIQSCSNQQGIGKSMIFYNFSQVERPTFALWWKLNRA